MNQYRVDVIRKRDKELLWSEIVPATHEFFAEQKVSDEFWDSEFFTDEAYYLETTQLFD